jgi:ribosomal protein L40E
VPCRAKVAVLEPLLIREAFKQHRAFSDWVCAHCSSRNKEGAVVCHVCDSARQEVDKASTVATGRVAARTTWDCGCGFRGNPIASAVCGFCTMPRGHFAPPGGDAGGGGAAAAASTPAWNCGCGYRGNPPSATHCGFCMLAKGHRFD